MPGLPVTPLAPSKASPLVGEVGGGPAASAADETLLWASSARADAAPPPNPPHKGEGFKRLALAPSAVERARELRNNPTDAEKVLWTALREAFPLARFRRQVPLGPYFADFCSHSAKLIIEADGGQHSAEASQAYDEARTRFLTSEGYRVLRFGNHDVLANTDGVLQAIACTLRERAH